MKKIIFYLITFYSFNCFANETDALIIDSTYANYDGKEIVLNGDVTVQQKFGKICADSIRLTPFSDQKKLSVSSLVMDGNVNFKLENGGEFLCAHANLDYTTWTGNFRGKQDLEYVIYSENVALKGDKKLPLVFKSRKMNVTLTKNEEGKNAISEIVATSHVTLNYNHDFIASSGKAVFKRLEKTEMNCMIPKCAGSIQLVPYKKDDICQITNKNGDLVLASLIDIDTAKRDLYFKEPDGFLITSQKENSLEKIYFESDEMDWNDEDHILTFRGNVKVCQDSYGELQAKDEVKLYYDEETKKKRINRIESLGETILTQDHPEKKFKSTLISYGKMLIDHNALKTTIESPVNARNQILDGKQVYFNDILGEIYADSAELNYVEEDHKINVEKLVLKGNIRILNRSQVNPEESEAFLQYAIADNVELYPKTQEMLLTADPDSRVLFYDKVNNLQVSAPAVTVKRNAITKKESIQGLGDVRFSLVDHELEKLKTHFSLEPSKELKL